MEIRMISTPTDKSSIKSEATMMLWTSGKAKCSKSLVRQDKLSRELPLLSPDTLLSLCCNKACSLKNNSSTRGSTKMSTSSTSRNRTPASTANTKQPSSSTSSRKRILCPNCWGKGITNSTSCGEPGYWLNLMPRRKLNWCWEGSLREMPTTSLFWKNQQQELPVGRRAEPPEKKTYLHRTERICPCGSSKPMIRSTMPEPAKTRK